MDIFVPSGALEHLSHLDVQSVFHQFACSGIPQRWKLKSAKSELNVGCVSYPPVVCWEAVARNLEHLGHFLSVDCKATVNTCYCCKAL